MCGQGHSSMSTTAWGMILTPVLIDLGRTEFTVSRLCQPAAFTSPEISTDLAFKVDRSFVATTKNAEFFMIFLSILIVSVILPSGDIFVMIRTQFFWCVGVKFETNEPEHSIIKFGPQSWTIHEECFHDYSPNAVRIQKRKRIAYEW